MRKKIKVLQVVSSLGLGGYERVVANLCRSIDSAKFDISVCCLKNIGIIGKKLLEEGFEVQILSSDRSFIRKYLVFLKLRQWVITKNIDIIHAHGRHAFFESTFSSMGLHKARFINTFHFGNYPHLPLKYKLLEAICTRVANQLVAVSEEQKQKLIKTYKLDPKRIITIWNGIEENKRILNVATIKGQFGIPPEAQVVGTIGNMIEQKGYPYFLEICKEINGKFSNVFFLIIGGGPLERAIRRKATDLKLEKRVIFAGYLPNATELIHAFDIFLLASLWEAMPIVLLEAMAAGKPIVATQVGENSRIVLDSETGFILPRKDVHGMIGRVKELLEDPERRKMMGIRGRARFKKLFTSATMTRRYEALYESLLYKKKGGCL